VVTYSIAQASQRSRLSTDTLRYYERIGLLDPPARDSRGRRNYTDGDIAWLGFLTMLRTTGMPIRVLREYVRLHHTDDGRTRLREILAERRDAVVTQIAELQACLAVLDQALAEPDPPPPSSVPTAR